MKQKIVILGAGESGVGTAILALQKGYDVFVSDFGLIKQQYKTKLNTHNINWEEGGHSFEKILQASVVMKSPGISDNAPAVKAIKEKGIKIISELEFAFPFTQATIVGITGTNGKTTTATLTYKLLKDGGLPVALGGNIGESFAGQVAQNNNTHFVLEISSFQLDDIEKFNPHIAVLVNITPDHLDRYNYDFNQYIQSKFRIIKNQSQEDYFIYDGDDPVINQWVANHSFHSQKIPFSLTKTYEIGAYIEQNQFIVKTKNNQFNMPIAQLGISGNHNLKNAMAASTVATLLKIRKETIRKSLENFQGVEHRLEKVLKINNVLYINDSKATNVNAAFFALDSMETTTVWIVGGVDKGNDYEALLPLVNEKVKAIICLGVDNTKIINAFGNIVEMVVETQSMKDAVQVAYRIADKGETVLLSPACASFDLFENYEDRGRQFKEAVRNL